MLEKAASLADSIVYQCNRTSSSFQAKIMFTIRLKKEVNQRQLVSQKVSFHIDTSTVVIYHNITATCSSNKLEHLQLPFWVVKNKQIFVVSKYTCKKCANCIALYKVLLHNFAYFLSNSLLVTDNIYFFCHLNLGLSLPQLYYY